jgi:hypothetical protein
MPSVSLDGSLNEVLVRCRNAVAGRMRTLKPGASVMDALVTLDEGSGVATLAWPNGETLRMQAQMVGAMRLTGGTMPGLMVFRWAWDDPGAPPHLRAHAQAVRAFGQSRNEEELTMSGDLVLNKDRAMMFACLAAELADATGVISLEVKEVSVLLTLSGPQAGAGAQF